MARATGGTITTSGEYTIHTFTSGGTFTPDSTLKKIDFLVVAGGGGGVGGVNGVNGGSAGAGGTVEERINQSITPSTPLTVVVGAQSSPGATGNNSSFNSITCTGGTAPTNASRTGGSNANYIGGTNSSGVNAGGGAGGGNNGSGSNGGNGYLSSISGTPTYYAGGGAAPFSSGVPGLGGGGTRNDSGAGGNGGTNTGGGGGGGTVGTTSRGGSGIVIVRYLTVAPTSGGAFFQFM